MNTGYAQNYLCSFIMRDVMNQPIEQKKCAWPLIIIIIYIDPPIIINIMLWCVKHF